MTWISKEGMGQRNANGTWQGARTRRNEGHHVTPAKAGVHLLEELDSRFRGNDVTSEGAEIS